MELWLLYTLCFIAKTHHVLHPDWSPSGVQLGLTVLLVTNQWTAEEYGIVISRIKIKLIISRRELYLCKPPPNM
jgi:hypothetical protein